MKTSARLIRTLLFLILWGGVATGLGTWLFSDFSQLQVPRIIGAIGKDAEWKVIRPGSDNMGENGWVFEVREKSGQPYELHVRYALLLDREMDGKHYSVTAAMKVAKLDKGQIAGLMLFKNTQNFQMIWCSRAGEKLNTHYYGSAGVPFGSWDADLSGHGDGTLLVLRLERSGLHYRPYVFDPDLDDPDLSWVRLGDAMLAGEHGYRPVFFTSGNDVAVDFQRIKLKLSE